MKGKSPYTSSIPIVDKTKPKYGTIQRSPNHLCKQWPHGYTPKKLEKRGYPSHVQNHFQPLQMLAYSSTFSFRNPSYTLPPLLLSA